MNFFFDPSRWWWPEVTPFFAYSAKEERKWIYEPKMVAHICFMFRIYLNAFEVIIEISKSIK